MVKVAFIEDDILTLNNLSEALRLQPDINCSLAVVSVEAFWENLPNKLELDLIFVDIQLPGLSGIEVIPALRRRFPKADIVMLTHMEEEDKMLTAFHAGASGYLVKGFSYFQLPDFIQTIRGGGALISPKMAKKLVQYHNPASVPTTDLNAKEMQILKIFASGDSYEDAAALLNISVDGVRYHVKNIYKKLQVNNKIDAIRVLNDGSI
jgi:DNA-binding NarL/FixJ family response regulator